MSTKNFAKSQEESSFDDSKVIEGNSRKCQYVKLKRSASHGVIEDDDDSDNLIIEERITPQRIFRKTQYILNSQPQHVYGAKYHINLQQAPQVNHYNSKSMTSVINQEQMEDKSIQQRENQNLTAAEDPAQLFSESLYRWQMMRQSQGSTNGQVIDDFTQRQILALKREKNELGKDKALLAQQVELLNLKVCDMEQRDQLERQNTSRFQKMLEHQSEALQRENTGLAIIINEQNSSIETLRSDCDKLREQFANQKRISQEVALKLAQAVETHDCNMRKIKEMHQKQLADLQESEIKPINIKISDLTLKLAKSQDQLRSSQQARQEIENQYHVDVQIAQSKLDSQKSHSELILNQNRVEKKEIQTRLNLAKDEILKIKAQHKTSQQKNESDQKTLRDKIVQLTELRSKSTSQDKLKKRKDSSSHPERHIQVHQHLHSARSHNNLVPHTTSANSCNSLIQLMIINCKKVICKKCESRLTWEDFVHHVRVQGTNTCQIEKPPKVNTRKTTLVRQVTANLIETSQFEQMIKTTDITHSMSLFRQKSESGLRKQKTIERVSCLLQTNDELELLQQVNSQLQNEIIKRNDQIADLQKEVNFLIKQLMFRDNPAVTRVIEANADLKILYNTPSGQETQISYSSDLVQLEIQHCDDVNKKIRQSNFAPQLYSHQTSKYLKN